MGWPTASDLCGSEAAFHIQKNHICPSPIPVTPETLHSTVPVHLVVFLLPVLTRCIHPGPSHQEVPLCKTGNGKHLVLSHWVKLLGPMGKRQGSLPLPTWFPTSLLTGILTVFVPYFGFLSHGKQLEVVPLAIAILSQFLMLSYWVKLLPAFPRGKHFEASQEQGVSHSLNSTFILVRTGEDLRTFPMAF